jgi:hypothetical protein
MSRQQNRVLQAMISLRTFTAADLQTHSGVAPATIRTVISRFQNSLDLLGRQATGRRGGQLSMYRIRPDDIHELINRIIEFVPADLLKLDDARTQLLELVPAHEALIGGFARAKSALEQQQLLESVQEDIETARQYLSELPQDDPSFVRIARRIEEVRELFLDRKNFLKRNLETDQEITRLGDVVIEAKANAPDSASPAFVLVGADIADEHKWINLLRRDFDKQVSCEVKVLNLSDPNEFYRFPWEEESIGGCFVTVDSSRIAVVDIIRAIRFMRELRRVLPVLVLDAQENGEFRRKVYETRGFYFSHAAKLGAQAILSIYIDILQSLRIAHRLVTDRTVGIPRSDASHFPGHYGVAPRSQMDIGPIVKSWDN